MKLCYQVATPEVTISETSTVYYGPLEETFPAMARMGYDGVELTTIDPDRLDWAHIKALAEENGLAVPLVCTGEVFGQTGLNFSDPDEKLRRGGIERAKRIIAFAAYLGGNVNFGRIRGQYDPRVSRETTWAWAAEAFRELSDYAAPLNVRLALEPASFVFANFINTCAEAEKMILQVDRPNFGMMMDIFHMNLEEKDLIGAIEQYSKYNLHVHLADNNRQYPGQCGFDFDRIFTAFRRCGYDGAFTTEIRQIPDIFTAAEQTIRHLEGPAQRVYGRTPKKN